MFEFRVADLAVETGPLLASKAGAFATAFEYTDEQATTPTAASRHRGRETSISRHSDRVSASPIKQKMATGYAVSPEPPALFVRAMYDYDADQAQATRHRFYDMAAAEKAMVVGFHFTFPSIGHVEKDGSKYRLVPIAWNPVI